jgi:hypothetical protein
MEAGSQKWDKDVVRYLVSYPTLSGWLPLCGLDANGDPIQAIPLEGIWDYRQGVAGGGSHLDDPASFTFACGGYALAKCVEMGYKPWQPSKICVKGQGCVHTTLAPVHQACTRMLRADYCGDGSSHTVDGTEIQAFDAYGIRSVTQPWEVEAEWGPEGARCVAQDRIPTAPTPTCAATLLLPDCGDALHFSANMLLISEVAP